MRRFLRSFLILGALALPLFASAQGFFGPIIPDYSDENGNLQTCAAGWQAVLIVLANIVKFAVSIGIIFAVLVIVYAGALFLFSSTNPENLSKGKKVLTNAVVGLLIALGSWLIVNTILIALGASGGVVGTTSILSGGGTLCIKTQTYATAPGNPDAYVTSGFQGGPLKFASGDCSPEALAEDWGDAAIGKTFSCIIHYESGCVDSADAGENGLGTTARGRYQIVFGYDDDGHNLNFPSCTAAAQAAGFTVSGSLNCSTAFSGGRAISQYSGACNPDNRACACRAASSNSGCNTDAAKWLYAHGGFNHWMGDSRASGQRECVRQHGT